MSQSNRTTASSLMRNQSNGTVNTSTARSKSSSTRTSLSENSNISGSNKVILNRNNNQNHRTNEAPEEKESNIHVYVRCRGRNEREINENSGVVVQTTGDKGREVMLKMGPMSLSDKTYTFDRVFGPEADQSMLFDGIADKILREMISGYNCTIFAYGQTGTGKTFTMSGDLTDNHGRPAHNAGIIPRTLFQLFRELDKETAEYSVKVSYIELYNEELRDLISQDDDRKVKIFDDANKKGIVIQGMEEAFIKSASEGLQILQDGSYKRQVAATKCNDLSSRSHSVFTITIHVKEVSEDDQEYVRIGKLNLVDLAGSENINRSGAQDMRAREAGMINQSLLTLGRVINALVDRSPHIPYRESKLTRLLQDSLGGRTKTCIIATVSPAKVSLEETISTLDYANRAKNIKNKPQVNQTLSKKMVLRDYVLEIERLRADIMATRQKTGIYLSEESHQTLIDESESRRALVEEQKLRVDALETQLKMSRDTQEELIKELATTKKEYEEISDVLESTTNQLTDTQCKLESTETKLLYETIIAKEYEQSLDIQRQESCKLAAKLDDAVGDINQLHSKIDRRAALENLNKAKHDMLQSNTQEFYATLNKKLNSFKASIIKSSSLMEHRVEEFLRQEVAKLNNATSLINQGGAISTDLNNQFANQLMTSKSAMEGAFNGISDIKNQIKFEISSGLEVLRTLAKQISVDILQEFQGYRANNMTLTTQIQTQTDEALKRACAMVSAQATEIKMLKEELIISARRVSRATELTVANIAQAVDEEKAHALKTHDNFIKTIMTLAQEITKDQNISIENRFSAIKESLSDEKVLLDTEADRHITLLTGLKDGNSQLNESLTNTTTNLSTSLSNLMHNQIEKGKIIETNTNKIHQDVSATLDDQIEQLDDKIKCLDTFVETAQAELVHHTSKYEQTLEAIQRNDAAVFESVKEQLSTAEDGLTSHQKYIIGYLGENQTIHVEFDKEQQSLADRLITVAQETKFSSYGPAGTSPIKAKSYEFTREFPKVKAREEIIEAYQLLDGVPQLSINTDNSIAGSADDITVTGSTASPIDERPPLQDINLKNTDNIMPDTVNGVAKLNKTQKMKLLTTRIDGVNGVPSARPHQQKSVNKRGSRSDESSSSQHLRKKINSSKV